MQHLKFRSKEITDERIIQEAIKSFEIDTQFEWTIQIDQNVFDEARTIIIKYGTQYAIRTLDALQLACAELISRTEETIFISSDEKQNAVAIEMGFRVIDPTTMNREPEL